MRIAIGRLALGRFERSVLLTGLRGVGKTVLLNEFGRMATSEGWVHAHLEATEDIEAAAAIARLTRRVLLELSLRERSKERARRALGVVRSFIKVHVPTESGSSLTIDFEAQPGRADSGELDSDLAGLLAEVGETASAGGSGVLLTIDELQYLAQSEFAALIVGLHQISQLGLPVVVAGAGLPSLPGLAGEARSYAERLFQYVEIGSLTDRDAARALEEPVEEEGGRWDADALRRILADTGGYPYFLQEYGKQAWNRSDGPVITATDAAAAAVIAREELDTGFFRARIDRATDAERRYLRAMASLGGPGPYRSGNVAKAMARTTSQVATVRDDLIKRGLCYSPRYGEVAFTVPMFDDFVRRTLGATFTPGE